MLGGMSGGMSGGILEPLKFLHLPAQDADTFIGWIVGRNAESL